MKKLIMMLIAVFLAVFIFSLTMLFLEGRDAKKDAETFEELLKIAIKEEGTNPIPELIAEDKVIPQIDISTLKKENPDCTAWIYIEDTNINYPVMHTPEEKEKYLYKSFYGKDSKSGTPFIDSRCTLESDNVIIYAHNMLNGTMFGSLKKYLDKSYFDSHKTIYLYRENEVKAYEIFAVVKTEIDDNWYSFINGASPALTEELINKSTIRTKTDLSKNEKFLTLSTCYGKSDKGRLLVVAFEMP